MVKFVFATLVCFTACFLAANGLERHSSVPFFDKPEFRGKSYNPPQPFSLPKDLQDNSGLADWELIVDGPLTIKSIRIITVETDENGDNYDWTVTDDRVMKILGEALVPSRMRRTALSDFGLLRGGVLGGALEGIMILELTDQKLVIGYSHVGFYFGVSRGSVHQIFESWMLAKQLDELIFEKRGKHLPAEVFAKLSGEATLQEQQTTYDELRKAEFD